MDDLIKREDVLNVLRAFGWTPIDGLYLVVKQDIPSADRPQGEWEDTGKDPSHSHPLTAIWYRCSECGYGTNTKTNYCPNCGAKMKQ